MHSTDVKDFHITTKIGQFLMSFYHAEHAVLLSFCYIKKES